MGLPSPGLELQKKIRALLATRPRDIDRSKGSEEVKRD